MTSSTEKGKVAVIGSGLIGRAWSTLFSSAGYHVALYDTVSSQLVNAKEAIISQLQELESKELLKGRHCKTAQEAFKLVTTTHDLAQALNGVFYVQECTPENLELKKKVFQNLEATLSSSEVILASSTSCIMPSKFTESLQLRQRCIVAHPINPPYYVPLVEVIPAPWTDASVIEQTIKLMKDIGQSPVLLKKETNGFIVNRLQYALIAEAWRLVEEGICSPEDVDTTMTEGLGLRYSLIGPFETMHLNADGIRDYCQRYGDNIHHIVKNSTTPSPLTGATLDTVEEDLCQTMPLDKLSDRRALRDRRLAALAVFRAQEKEDN
ncbi:lambda-crystallin [Nematostella vectensis]|uniref:lambda-crystallin n=1 Tax=Nematostella vectensis TaxID=45351 RepID=UPI00207745EE|nr:lambda-crystallin [Nematostella vectensis]XP_032235445.2 lambda-crystallin [Nematostella vectensis]